MQTISRYEEGIYTFLKKYWKEEDIERQKHLWMTDSKSIQTEYNVDYFIKSIGCIIEVKDAIDNPDLYKIVDMIQVKRNQENYPEIRKGVVITCDGIIHYVNKNFIAHPFQRGCLYHNKDGVYNFTYECDSTQNNPSYSAAKMNDCIDYDFGQSINDVPDKKLTKIELITEIDAALMTLERLRKRVVAV